LRIVIDIKNCSDCRHKDHSGVFTKGGARDICGHPNSVECAIANKSSVKRGDDKYHWRHRVINKYPKTPGWCPLIQGYNY
jgi:hypothetical protein